MSKGLLQDKVPKTGPGCEVDGVDVMEMILSIHDIWQLICCPDPCELYARDAVADRKGLRDGRFSASFPSKRVCSFTSQYCRMWRVMALVTTIACSIERTWIQEGGEEGCGNLMCL